jgi:hypothetical protein
MTFIQRITTAVEARLCKQNGVFPSIHFTSCSFFCACFHEDEFKNDTPTDLGHNRIYYCLHAHHIFCL